MELFPEKLLLCRALLLGRVQQIVLHVLASGLRAGHPPKTIRTDQWISEEAVVLGLEAEILFAEALEPGKVVLHLEHESDIITAGVEQQVTWKSFMEGLERCRASAAGPCKQYSRRPLHARLDAYVVKERAMTLRSPPTN